MKKNRCYPKYSYIVSIALAIVLLAFAMGPIFIKTDDKLSIKIFWSFSMLCFSLFSFVNALILMQYYVIENGKIIVKSFYGTIVSLEISNCLLIIQNLPTFSSWLGSTYKPWLCIYLKNDNILLFEKGCNNRKKYNRIQIIYSKKNSAIMSQYFESDVKKYLMK